MKRINWTTVGIILFGIAIAVNSYSRISNSIKEPVLSNNKESVFTADPHDVHYFIESIQDTLKGRNLTIKDMIGDARCEIFENKYSIRREVMDKKSNNSKNNFNQNLTGLVIELFNHAGECANGIVESKFITLISESFFTKNNNLLLDEIFQVPGRSNGGKEVPELLTLIRKRREKGLAVSYYKCKDSYIKDFYTTEEKYNCTKDYYKCSFGLDRCR